ncbi:MAG: hypothetical protein F9K23_07560 [Bacteroidetes bacterium]|nr:MAG: hypothetical protein F9K23_07560 [Bacteroidota bacterium]
MGVDLKFIFCKVVKNNIGVWLFSIIFIVSKFLEPTIFNYLLLPFGLFYHYLIYVNVVGSNEYNYLFVFQIIGCLFLPFGEIHLNISPILPLIIFLVGLPSAFYAYKTFICIPQSMFKDRRVLLLAVFVPVFSFKIKSFLLENFCKEQAG